MVKLWRARRVRDGVPYLLGYFETEDEAVEAERQFDESWPSNRGHYWRVV